MDNQHRKIKGHRELSEDEIDAMNAVKEAGERIEQLLDLIMHKIDDVDRRWLAIGTTELQQGLMAVTRAIARPTTF